MMNNIKNNKTYLGIRKFFACAFCLLFAAFGLLACADEPEPDPEPVKANNEWPTAVGGVNSDFTDEDLIWQEEFNGTSLDSGKWRYDIGRGKNGNGWGNQEAQYYREENARIDGGMLQIIAREETYQTARYTSSKILTDGKFSMKYGKAEIRARLPVGQGFWPAFWMMPQASVYGDWPRSGEIDVLEAKGRLIKQTSSALHYGTPHAYKTYTKFLPANGEKTIADWRTYGVEWRPGEIKFLVDGAVSVRYAVDGDSADWFSFDERADSKTGGVKLENGAPYNQEFFLILNFAIGGTFDGGLLPLSESFVPAVMEVDWVRAFRLPGLENELTFTVNGTRYNWNKQEIIE